MENPEINKELVDLKETGFENRGNSLFLLLLVLSLSDGYTSPPLSVLVTLWCSSREGCYISAPGARGV